MNLPKYVFSLKSGTMYPMWIYPGSPAQQNQGELQNTIGKLPLTAVQVRLKLGLRFMWFFIPTACAKQMPSASVRELKLKQAQKLWDKSC